MYSTSHFYNTLNDLIKEARVHVSLFLPIVTHHILTKKRNFFSLGLGDSIRRFSKQKCSLLEVIFSESEKSFSSVFTKKKENVIICSYTDNQFIAPLKMFAESFAIIDGQTTLVMPFNDNNNPVGFVFENNSKRAFYFQLLFSQILQHERELDNYMPVSDNRLNLLPIKHCDSEIVSYLTEISQYKIKGNINFNPFINRIINQYERGKNDYK